MSSFRIRPRFKHLVSNRKDDIEQMLKNALENKKNDFFSEDIMGQITIKTPVDRRHIWSPQLNLTFEESENGTIIRGLYGPNPTIWAVFFFGYVILGILFVFVGLWGLTRWSLDLSTEVLWGLPIFAGLYVALYLFAQTGQKMGAREMYDLHYFYEEVVHEKVVIS